MRGVIKIGEDTLTYPRCPTHYQSSSRSRKERSDGHFLRVTGMGFGFSMLLGRLITTGCEILDEWVVLACSGHGDLAILS